MTVRQSYVLWFSQRVGSTLLARTLDDLGIAGHPHEWLEAENTTALQARFGVWSGEALRVVLWRLAATPNGVLGLKYGPWKNHAATVALLGDWNAVFPNCKHVFMTRRNKVRLAVSWLRAINSGEWHRQIRDEPKGPPGFRSGRYDRNQIGYLVREASERESLIAAQLAAWGVTPYTIVYEEMIAAYEPTVRALLEFLEIPGRAGVTIPAPAFARLADEVSDEWCERYLRDMFV